MRNFQIKRKYVTLYSVKQVVVHIQTSFYVLLVISDKSIHHVHLLLIPQFV